MHRAHRRKSPSSPIALCASLIVLFLSPIHSETATDLSLPTVPIGAVRYVSLKALAEFFAQAEEIGGDGFTWRTDTDSAAIGAAATGDSSWQVHWLPSGFELKESKIQSMATSHMPVSHLVYSDGLAMVSVFVEKLMDGEQVLQGYSSRGAVNAFSRVADDHQITVVGEVPLPTVRQIAASVAKVDN